MSDYQSPGGAVPQPGPGYQPPGAYPPPPSSGYPPAPGGYPGQQPAYPPAAPQYPAPPAYPASAPPAYPASAPPGYPASAPPGYPPPGYPPVMVPGAVPGPPPKKSRVGLIVGIIAAVVVLCAALGGVGIYLFARSVKGPADVVNAWFTAGFSGDEAKLKSLTCAELRDDIEISAGDLNMSNSPSWTVTSVDTVNDTSTVTVQVSYTEDGEQHSETIKLHMVKEGGDWKVCGDASSTS